MAKFIFILPPMKLIVANYTTNPKLKKQGSLGCVQAKVVSTFGASQAYAKITLKNSRILGSTPQNRVFDKNFPDNVCVHTP